MAYVEIEETVICLDDAVKLGLQWGPAVTGEAAKQHSLDFEVCQRARLVPWQQLKIPVKQPLQRQASCDAKMVSMHVIPRCRPGSGREVY